MKMSFRPALRSNLARSLYDRIQKEEALRNYDKSQWYRCNLDFVHPEILQNQFIQSHFDQETKYFLDQCQEKSDWIFTQLFHAVAKALLCWFMTRTSVNGFLNRGSMFVFSRPQLELLLGILGSNWKGEALLDLGAGDGAVTKIMSNYFYDVHVTEMSPVMRRILGKQGFKVLEVDSWWLGSTTYDVISCLNVLDRCENPITLLKQMKEKLKPKTGLLVIAIVLPIIQYVESARSHTPKEELPIDNHIPAEKQLSQLIDKVFKPLDLEVVRWTKLPYLSEGDIDQYFYWLDDYIIVLRQKTSILENLMNNTSCSSVDDECLH